MKDFIILDNGTIKAKVLYPNNSKYYRARFNHAGFIYDVWYKGVKFSEYEKSQPNFPTTEGSGLCCQYGIFNGDDTPEKGEKVLRPGIGVSVFDPDKKSEEHTPFDTKFTYDDVSATFTTVTPEVGGYAYEEIREIKLIDGEITEKVTLKNIGKKKIVSKEYCHNFLSLGGKDISPDYSMKVHCINDPESFEDGDMYYKDGEFTFKDYPSKSYIFKTTDTKKSTLAWEMKDKKSSVACYEKVDFTPSNVAVWGDHYVLCCEVFVPIELDVGESCSWQRTWGFSL